MRTFLVSLLMVSQVWAADAKKKSKLDLGLNVDVGASIPKGEDLQKPQEKRETVTPTQPAGELSWSVVKVQHGKAFKGTPQGSVVAAAYEVGGNGDPFTTEQFTTVVRIKCAQRRSAPIELAVLDSRGNTAMEGSGTVQFRTKSDESDYTLVWDPTPLRGPGDYTFTVKVNGSVIGSYPMKIVDRSAPKGDVKK
jgi:hypothetical protein